MFDFNLQFARNGADFTMELFRQVVGGQPVKDNIVFSPFSIQTCIALAFAGAQGETADNIADVMKFASNSPPEVAETFQFVLEKYKHSDLLKIANKVYVQHDRSIKDAYQQTLKENYYAEAEAVNFCESVEAAQTMNSWVESKTAGKISNLISPDCLDANTRLVLLNALHFKGNWAHKFDEASTLEDDFWTSEEHSVKVNFMCQKAKFGYGYFPELDCSALEMPYKDSDLSMFVLLPSEREGLKVLGEKLKSVNLVDLAEKMFVEEVQVKFPKFKVDYSVELSDTLKKLGLTKIFEDDADFSKMLEPVEDLTVSKIIHKACIEVNEEGTEAAAATGMVMMTRCLLMPMQFLADRPFLYMIWNKKNILFAGAFVNAPSL